MQRSDIVRRHLNERALRSKREGRQSIKEYEQRKLAAQKKAKAANQVPQWYIRMVKAGGSAST